MQHKNIITEQELSKFREDTSGTLAKIHFNNAGSSLNPSVVVDTVVNYLREEAVIGGYEAEFKYKQQIEYTYELIARLINAERDEIAIVENASTAWGLAFNGIKFDEGDVIITSEMEYVTNLIGFIHLKKTKGIKVQVIPNDEQGNFQLKALEAAITPNTKLIAITHIASAAGTVLPIVEIGKIARKYGVLYLVDACQTVGQVPIDVKEIGCDILSVTGRKYLRAPRGTGFLFVKKSIQDQLEVLLIDGHTAELISEDDYRVRADCRRFELYEKSRALTLGLGKAVEYALAIGVDRIWERIQSLAGAMRTQLKEIEGVTIHDNGTLQCGIVTFSVNNIESQVVKAKLSEKNINVSVGLAKSTFIYMNKNELVDVIRASVHYYNTDNEINILCRELTAIINN
ncbi:aminotransferase class V-fold PLP-dependent enzyme [Pedobacter sp. L105]|uniref:aminotransferase class V-fold PLP-dependent enzyme n=1 Tax=Pedobacter sp. L105 TaxID=1641871 RepID=UPI00131E7705|nr:aminotransferase class V-fold PLP-dependent enzyme [Pedobacter sp. L105]